MAQNIIKIMDAMKALREATGSSYVRFATEEGRTREWELASSNGQLELDIRLKRGGDAYYSTIAYLSRKGEEWEITSAWGASVVETKLVKMLIKRINTTTAYEAITAEIRKPFERKIEALQEGLKIINEITNENN